jgi:hypothetical protein
LLDEVSQGQVTKREPLDHARSILKRIDPVRIAIKKIRNKVVAHQDDRLSQPQVYAAAKLNLPALTEISNASLEIANFLCTACDLPTQQFLTGHIDRLRAMLEALRASPLCL